MGLGEIIFLGLFVAALWISLMRRQLLAVCVAGIGLLLLAWFGLSVAFGESHPFLAVPYRITNIYVFLFVAVELTLAGGIAMLVRFVRHFRHERKS